VDSSTLYHAFFWRKSARTSSHSHRAMKGFLVLLTGGLIQAQSTIDAVALTKRLGPSVVVLKSDRAIGSGVIVSQGKIATSLHVVQNASTLMVETSNGDLYAGASVWAFDSQRDLAVLKVPGFDLPSVELGDSNQVLVGEPVMAIGTPELLAGTVTVGVVSAVRQDPFGRGFRVIQTDAAINHGNSGGPLINNRAQVIGIIWGGPTENLNFAVTVNYLRALLSEDHSEITLAELKATLARNAVAEPSVQTMVPKLWKSLSGTDRYEVRLDGEFLYAERIFSRVDLMERIYEGVKRPEDIYRKIEAKKSGNLYAGKVRYGGTCTTGVGTKSCAFQDQVEFTLVTPTRIEGAVQNHPADARFDCRKCIFSKPKQIVKFTWIPE
jgi:hypothetical protein